MADKVAAGIVRKLYATEPDPAELAAGRDLVLELLDLYVDHAEKHIAFHEAHRMDHFAENFRVRLAVATATRDRILAGERL